MLNFNDIRTPLINVGVILYQLRFKHRTVKQRLNFSEYGILYHYRYNFMFTVYVYDKM